MTDGNQLDSIEKALNDAAAKTGTLWISFISLVVYLAIAVGSVTHRMLFLQEPIKLPVLNVDLPLIGFFIVAPLLLVTYHFYLLLQLAVLASKAAVYERSLREELTTRTERDDRRQRLDQFPFVQLLVGGGRRQGTSVRTATVMISVVTLVGAPVLVLTMVQIVFVPYHDLGVTWLHRLAVVLDILLLWVFWSSGSFSFVAQRQGQGLQPIHVPVLALALSLAIFSVCVATFPGEGPLALRQYLRGATELTDTLFAGPVDRVTGQRTSWFSNTLVLSEQDLIDRERAEKLEEKLRTSEDGKGQLDALRTLRSRDLRGAVLNGADLRFIDFTAANLRDASLVRTRLTGTKFDCAFIAPKEVRSDKRRSIVDRDYDNDESCVSLNGATFDRASGQNASFDGPRLVGAIMDDASLQGANFHKAAIWGVSFARSKLQGANFSESDIIASYFPSAWMHGADLRGATIEATSFSGSVLIGADLGEVSVSATAVESAQLQGASLRGGTFDIVSFVSSNLWRASLDKASFANVFGSTEGKTLLRMRATPTFTIRLDNGNRISFDLGNERSLEQAVSLATVDVLAKSTKGQVEKRVRSGLVVTDKSTGQESSSVDPINKMIIDIAAYRAKLAQSLVRLVCGKELQPEGEDGLEEGSDAQANEIDTDDGGSVSTSRPTAGEVQRATVLLRGIVHNNRLGAIRAQNFEAFRKAILDPTRCPLLPATRREDLDAVDATIAKITKLFSKKKP